MGEFVPLCLTSDCPTTRAVPWGWFLLQAIGHILALSTLHTSGRVLFVIQSGQRVHESCCLRGVRLTPLFCGCLPLSKETQNFFVVHGAIPRLRYDGPVELRGTQFHLLCISSGSPQCGEYYDCSSWSLSFLLFCSSAQDVICFGQMLDLGTLPAAAIPAKETKAAHGSVPVLRSYR